MYNLKIECLSPERDLTSKKFILSGFYGHVKNTIDQNTPLIFDNTKKHVTYLLLNGMERDDVVMLEASK